MNYTRFSWGLLFAGGFMSGYLMLSIYVSPLIPLFATYPDLMLIPYSSLIFGMLSYYLNRNISEALKVSVGSCIITAFLAFLYIRFPDYKDAVGDCIRVGTVIFLIGHFFYNPKNDK